MSGGLTMVVLEPKERFKQFENLACEVKVDAKVPILRYFRSGKEILRMGNVYYQEENYENAYILYHKYVTLFVEKLKAHPEFKSSPVAEKNTMLTNLKTVMSTLEKLKKVLSRKFEEEYLHFRIEEELRNEEQEKMEAKVKNMKLSEVHGQLLEAKNKYHDEKERALALQRDRELALWHQRQIDFELMEEEAARHARLRQGKPNEPSPQHVSFVPTPSFDRSSKPEGSKSIPSIPDRSSKPASFYSNRNLRKVTVPSILTAKFLSLAEKNTEKNVETCGVLAGKLAQNSFRVTHVLLPKQSGTSDSCITECEEEIFEYQDTHDLITLGWVHLYKNTMATKICNRSFQHVFQIHTHPTQSAFLSSVDLHTHRSYQSMLPEAIAIVVAPKFSEVAFLVLTPDYGLDFIGNCTETGFHPHPKDPPLFEEASHVLLDHDADVVFADLRK